MFWLLFLPTCANVQSTYHDIISGLKYENENENDLKDKQDFEKEAPSHYPPNGKGTL